MQFQPQKNFPTVKKAIDKRTEVVFTLFGNVINIKCYFDQNFIGESLSQQDVPIFNISYKFTQLPYILQKTYLKISDLLKDIADAKCTLQIENRNFLIFNIKRKERFQLSLGDKIENQKFQIVKHHVDLTKNKMANMSMHPFNAIGRLEFQFIIKYINNQGRQQQKIVPGTGTGTLIRTNLVLTAAHNVYHRDSLTKAKAQNFFFCLPAANGEQTQRKKVKNIYFPQQYQKLGRIDYLFYEYAVIQLHQNQGIRQDVPLEIQWNYEVNEKQLLTISGYPQYDTQKQYFDSKAKIGSHQRYIEYGHLVTKGHSGSAIMINSNLTQKYRIIGVHYGENSFTKIKFGNLLNSFPISPQFMVQKWFQKVNKNVSKEGKIPQNIQNQDMKLQSKIQNQTNQSIMLYEQNQRLNKALKSQQQIVKQLKQQLNKYKQKQLEIIKGKNKINNLLITKQDQDRGHSIKQQRAQLRPGKLKESQTSVINSQKTKLQNDLIRLKVRRMKNKWSDQYGAFEQIQCNQNQRQVDLKQTDINDSLLGLFTQRLTKLEQLDLYRCKQLQNIELANCPLIKKLNLGETKVTDNQLTKISQQLSLLEQLDLESCKNLKFFKLNCGKLKKLNLRNTQIVDNTLELLGQSLPKLQQLNLWSCSQLKKLNLKDFSKLKKLNLKNTQITGIILNQLPELEQLDSYSCYQLKNITVNNCSKLKRLNLSYTQITDTELKCLVEQLLQLEQIELYDCKIIQNVEFISCSKLKKLNLKQTQITDILLDSLPELEQVNLYSCYQLEGIKVNNCEKIRKLDLSNTQVTDKQLKQLIKQLPKLEQLNLYSCYELEIVKFVRCKQLKKIVLRQAQITDIQLDDLNELEQLDLQSCKLLQNITVNDCKQLKHLDLRLSSISQAKINQLHKQLPTTEISL